jgi:flagella basal body P-ring formation protein FlgA
MTNVKCQGKIADWAVLLKTLRVGFMHITLPAILPLFFALVSLFATSATAQTAKSSNLLNIPQLRAQASDWLMQQALTAHPGNDVQVSVGEIDARQRLPACNAPQFFLPASAQFWGRGSLGVRCDAPAKWSIYLTYQSRLFGFALVATRPIAAPAQLQAEDIELRQIEYTQSPDLYTKAMPANARLNRPLAAGQPILIGGLTLATVIQSGRKVRLQTRTATFTVSQEGMALNNAAPGDLVRVKTPGGRIVQGVANQDGSVEVTP